MFTEVSRSVKIFNSLKNSKPPKLFSRRKECYDGKVDESFERKVKSFNDPCDQRFVDHAYRAKDFSFMPRGLALHYFFDLVQEKRHFNDELCDGMGQVRSH